MSMDTVKGGGTVERVLKLHKALNIMPDNCSHILSIDVGEETKTGLPKDEITQLPCLNKRWYLPVPKLKVVKELIIWADVIHITNHWTVINAWIYILVRMLKKPYVVCPAGSLSIFGRSKLLKKIYHFLIGNKVIKNASAGVVVSEDETKDLIESGLDAALIYHIPNGVNDSEYKFNDPSLFKEIINIKDEPFILFVGRLNRIKGPDILLDAFALIGRDYDHHLVFVGPDEGLKSILEETIQNNNLEDRVHFFDFISGNIKSSAYHGADFLVVPSRHEAMSIVALEAAISGTPVLLSSQCGFSELADAGGAIEVEPTVSEINNGLKTMLMSTSIHNDMGEHGRLFVQKKFTWKIAAEKYAEMFSILLDENIHVDKENNDKSYASIFNKYIGKIIFPITLSLNMFSMTALLIILGIFKKAELAADVGIVQSATLIVFLAFSTNARNIILSGNENISLGQFFKFRSVLVVPLAFVAYFLCENFVDLELWMVFFLIFRRSMEWIAELQINERELLNDKRFAHVYSGTQMGVFALVFLTIFLGLDDYFFITFIFWSISPIFLIIPFLKSMKLKDEKRSISWHTLLPHLGSSWVIASSTYIFRVLIVLIAGKAIGGILFSAYALGGIINSIYTYALGPTIAANLNKDVDNKEWKVTKLIVYLLLSLGSLIAIVSMYSSQFRFNAVDFSLALGLSIIGSGIMLVAQRRRIHIIQKDKSSVFMPDVLANTLIILSVPFAYYLIGVSSLSGLFLWNSLLTYIIYRMTSMKYKNGL